MSNVKKPEVNELTLGISPFSHTFIIEATKVIESGQYMTIKDEDGNSVTVPRESIRERQQTTKLYHCPGCKDIIYNLSPGSMKLWIYIIYNLEQGKDWIWINIARCRQKLDMKSINTYKTAIKELIRYSLIAGSAIDDVYWINPNLYFSGDRISKFEKNVIVKNTWDQTKL